LKLPGSVPAYSGVQNSTASAAVISSRSRATSGGTRSPSSSGLNAGSRARPSYRIAVTCPGATAAAVTSAAVFPEPARVLPDTSSTLTGSLTPPG
jgi:hypothetical protein